MSGGELRVSPAKDEMFTALAADLVERLAAVQAEGRVPQVCLTGGSVADTVHAEVARLTREGAAPGLDWSRVEVFWGDERFVEPEDPDRNEKQAHDSLLDHVGVDPARVHPMPSTDEASDVHDAARQYEELLEGKLEGPFDVLMHGLGDDRHIASLFPGHPTVHARDALAIGVEDSPKPPPERVSLTLIALARTRAVWFLAVGAGKAEAVAATRAEGATPDEAPGSALLDAPEVRWYLDAPAAGQA